MKFAKIAVIASILLVSCSSNSKLNANKKMTLLVVRNEERDANLVFTLDDNEISEFNKYIKYFRDASNVDDNMGTPPEIFYCIDYEVNELSGSLAFTPSGFTMAGEESIRPKTTSKFFRKILQKRGLEVSEPCDCDE